MNVEWRPVHRLVACAACPCGVSTAMSQAGNMSDEHLSRAECVPVRAPCWRVDDPLPGRGLHQFAQHKSQAYVAGGAKPGASLL
jgi:hypothetical protein